MLVKANCHNVKCDCCGRIANEEVWSVDETEARQDAMENHFFLRIDGKDYCPDCYHYDDNDRIITKDGRVFDGETFEEIKL